jgi:dipeptidase E
MKIFFAGGGSKEKSKDIDQAFLSSIPKNAKILYIPIALKKKYSAKDCFKWFSETYPELKGNTTYVDDLSSIKDLSVFAAIYIGGGNTFSLLEDIKKAGFDKKMMAYLNKGGIIYGGSAGAIILGKSILSTTDKNECGLKDFSGLGVVSEAIWPHYDESENPAIKDFVKKHGINVYALSEEGGLVLSESKISAVGKKVVLFSGNEEKKLK